MAKVMDKRQGAANAAEMLYNAAAGDCIKGHALPAPAGSGKVCSAIADGATVWAAVFAGSGKSNDLFPAWTTAFRATAARAIPLEVGSYRQAAAAALQTLENWLDFSAAGEAGKAEAAKAAQQDQAAQATTIASLQKQIDALKAAG